MTKAQNPKEIPTGPNVPNHRRRECFFWAFWGFSLGHWVPFGPLVHSPPQGVNHPSVVGDAVFRVFHAWSGGSAINGARTVSRPLSW